MESSLKIKLLYKILLGLFFTLIPFEDSFSAVPNVLLIVLVSLAMVLVRRAALKQFLSEHKYFLFLLGLFFSMLLLAITLDRLTEDLFFYKKFILVCILVPLSIPIRDTEYLKMVFSMSVLLAIFVSTFNIYYAYHNSLEFNFSRGSHINALLISERLYLSFMCVVSMIFSLSKMSDKKNRFRIMHGVNSVIIIAFLLLITARMALISSTLILIYFLFTRLRSRHRVIGLFFLLILFSLFYYFNPNMSKRFLHSDDIYTSDFVERIKKHEPRYEIWTCSMQAVKLDEKFFLGYGFAKTKMLLSNCFDENIEVEKRKKWFVETGFNTHNQFIDILLGSGIFAFIGFFLVFFSLIFQIKLNFTSVSLVFLLLLYMMIENILHRQLGCYILSLCLIVMEKRRGKP